jgi:hypothetical protein
MKIYICVFMYSNMYVYIIYIYIYKHIYLYTYTYSCFHYFIQFVDTGIQTARRFASPANRRFVLLYVIYYFSCIQFSFGIHSVIMPFWLVRMEIDFVTHCHVVILLIKHHHHHQGYRHVTTIYCYGP